MGVPMCKHTVDSSQQYSLRHIWVFLGLVESTIASPGVQRTAFSIGITICFTERACYMLLNFMGLLHHSATGGEVL